MSKWDHSIVIIACQLHVLMLLCTTDMRQANSGDVDCLNNLASLMKNVRADYDKAERMCFVNSMPKLMSRRVLFESNSAAT